MTVVFRGRVQGVGFRYTVCVLAQPFPITGIVRNEEDGSVYVEAEGVRKDLEEFLCAILHSRLARYILHHRAEMGNPRKGYRGFSVGR